MITGVGLDIAEISRFNRLVEDTAFLSRVFSYAERAYIAARGARAPETAAGLFCAKEALSKALGSGLSGHLLREAEVLHEEGGRPYFSFSGTMLEKCAGLKVNLSITHSDLTACAVAICEKPGEGF